MISDQNFVEIPNCQSVIPLQGGSTPPKEGTLQIHCKWRCAYPFVLLHILQMGFLTNAQIEKSLPLVPHWIPLSLERRHRPVLASGPQVVTLQRRLLATTGDGTWMVALAGCLSSMSLSPSSWSLLTSLSWASRLLFLKCWWTLKLQGSRARFMNRYINIFCGIGGNWTRPSQPHLSGAQCSGGVLFRGVAGPHTVCGCRAGPPCGHSSPASWSCPAPPPRSSVPSDCRACIHAGFSGNGHATWSCPEHRVKKSKVQKTSRCPVMSSFVFLNGTTEAVSTLNCMNFLIATGGK